VIEILDIGHYKAGSRSGTGFWQNEPIATAFPTRYGRRCAESVNSFKKSPAQGPGTTTAQAGLGGIA
jgi:hypothetical protein